MADPADELEPLDEEGKRALADIYRLLAERGRRRRLARGEAAAASGSDGREQVEPQKLDDFRVNR